MGIVNIINFIRAVEPRIPDRDLVEPVCQQIQLARHYKLPTTWLVQYDALIEPRFLELLQKETGSDDEIGGWWEIVEPQVKEAGIPWRGRFPWDWHCHVGFSIGYTPEERERLCDVYMHRFKETFGRYPESVGSWFMDAHTLAYMHDRYGVIASCNCKDQRGTDGYTLWGGYFNQAYYPSRKNAYMPAQSECQQIPVPIFRMLGSDPIYQYDAGGPGTRCQPVVSLEPSHFSKGGMDPSWVRWFFDVNFNSPHLSFGYAQMGQENSFGWPDIKDGLTDQLAFLSEWAKAGKVRVETLSTSAKWFRSTYPLTPASAVTALTDWKDEGRKSIWYCSCFYRVNILWIRNRMFIRDMHLFNEDYAEPHIVAPCTTPDCVYDTLPVFDSGTWGCSGSDTGLSLITTNRDGQVAAITGGEPAVREEDPDTLTISWTDEQEHKFEIRCQPGTFILRSSFDGWRLRMPWPSPQETRADISSQKSITFIHKGFEYSLTCARGKVVRAEDNNSLIFEPAEGQLHLQLASDPPPKGSAQD